MHELGEQIKLAKAIQAPSKDMDEPKKLLKILRKIDDSVRHMLSKIST